VDAPRGTILLVEDEDSIGRLVKGYLEQREGWDVEWVRTGEDALVRAASGPRVWIGSSGLSLRRSCATLATAGWTRLLEALLVAAAVGTALAVLTALGLARVIARPVRRVAEATRPLAQGAPPEPLPLEGPGELVALAASFTTWATSSPAPARQSARSSSRSVMS